MRSPGPTDELFIRRRRRPLEFPLRACDEPRDPPEPRFLTLLAIDHLGKQLAHRNPSHPNHKEYGEQ